MSTQQLIEQFGIRLANVQTHWEWVKAAMERQGDIDDAKFQVRGIMAELVNLEETASSLDDELGQASYNMRHEV